MLFWQRLTFLRASCHSWNEEEGSSSSLPFTNAIQNGTRIPARDKHVNTNAAEPHFRLLAPRSHMQMSINAEYSYTEDQEETEDIKK